MKTCTLSLKQILLMVYCRLLIWRASNIFNRFGSCIAVYKLAVIRRDIVDFVKYLDKTLCLKRWQVTWRHNLFHHHSNWIQVHFNKPFHKRAIDFLSTFDFFPWKWLKIVESTQHYTQFRQASLPPVIEPLIQYRKKHTKMA